MSTVNPSLIWSLAAVFVALTGGTLVRIVALRSAAADMAASRFGSLKTWWVLAGLLSMAAIFGEIGIAALLSVAAGFALKEFMSLIGREVIDTPTRLCVYSVIPLYYTLVLFGHQHILREATPVCLILLFGGLRAWRGNTQAYLRSTSAIIFGELLFVYSVSHALFLLGLSPELTPKVGNIGWFLYLILLTESNDIMQAITGRRFGRTKITPRVSPNKTLEGLIGGMLSTMILSAVSSPWLTTITIGYSAASAVIISLLCGMMISIAGFLGDINMSAIKRDAGVKDGSDLLPGQGGMIDRIDSLTFTAPAFYYFVRILMKVNSG